MTEPADLVLRPRAWSYRRQRLGRVAAEPFVADAIDLLPKWDPYTMGHAPEGRRRLVEDEKLCRAYTTGQAGYGATAGDGLPPVLRGGRAVATWLQRLAGN